MNASGLERSTAWPSPIRAWFAVGVFAIAAVLSYTDRQILSLLVDPIRTTLSITDTQVSLLQGLAFALIYSFAGLPLGRVADIWPRRRIILIGVSLWTVATLACGLAQSFGALFAARVFVGVGEAALAPAVVSMLADYFPPQRRGTAIGLFLMGMVIGGGAAIGIGGGLLQAADNGVFAHVPLLGHLLPWRTTLVVLGLSGFVMAALILGVREPRRRSDASDGTQHRWPLSQVIAGFVERRGVLLPLYVAMALMSIGDFGLLSWTPALLSRRFGMDPGHIGALIGATSIVAAILGVLGGGALADRATARNGMRGRLVIAAGAATLALTGVVIGFAGSPNVTMLCFGAWTLLSTAAGVAGIVAVQDIVTTEMRGLSVGLVSFGNILLGLGGGATLPAILTDHVFHDPKSVGLSLTAVIAPAWIIAVVLFWQAARAARVLRSPNLAATP
ncbi:MAG: MFS transporter [Rhodanobacteraceae bacterium]